MMAMFLDTSSTAVAGAYREHETSIITTSSWELLVGWETGEWWPISPGAALLIPKIPKPEAQQQ